MSDDQILLNRLLVLVQIFLIPIYFIFFTIYWHDEIIAFFTLMVSNQNWLANILTPTVINILSNVGIIIIFSFPWVTVSIIRATRIANAYSLMGRALGKVRIDQKLFYGLNAAFVMIFFVLPFGSPLITVISIFVFVRAGMRKIKIGKWIKLTWIIPALILSFIPILVAIAFYVNYVDLLAIIFNVWNNSTDTIFGIGLALAIAISIGNFFLFLFEGRAKYERNVEVPYGIVLVIKFFLFGVLVMIYLSEGYDIVNYVNYAAVVFAFLEMALRKIKDVPSETSSKFGIVMVVVFSLVNMLTNWLTAITSIAKTLVILISGFIFFGLFALSYRYADDPELID